MQLATLKCHTDAVCIRACESMFIAYDEPLQRCWCYTVRGVIPYCRAPYDFYNK